MSTELEALRKFLEEHKDTDPIETAKAFGIDISLLQYNLSLAQRKRIQQLQEWMRFQSNVKWLKSKNS